MSDDQSQTWLQKFKKWVFKTRSASTASNAPPSQLSDVLPVHDTLPAPHLDPAPMETDPHVIEASYPACLYCQTRAWAEEAPIEWNTSEGWGWSQSALLRARGDQQTIRRQSLSKTLRQSPSRHALSKKSEIQKDPKGH